LLSERVGTVAVVPTSFAAHLAAMDDERLAGLLRRRPDLCRRHHGQLVWSFEDLADRAGHWSSQAALLVRLDRFERAVLDLALLRGSSGTVADVVTVSGGVLDAADAAAGLDALAGVGLVWFDDDGRWHVAGQLRSQYLHPCGLGRPFERLAAKLTKDQVVTIADHLYPVLDVDAVGSSTRDQRPGRGGPVKDDYVRAVADLLADRRRVEAVLASCPDEELVDGYTAAVEREVPVLAVGWGFGASLGPRARYVGPGGRGGDPADWLAERGLLLPSSSSGLAEIPAEVGLAFRGGRPIPTITRHPPAVVGVAAGPPGTVAAASTAAAMAVLDTVTGVIHAAEGGSLKANKSGGVGVRAIRTLAKQLDRDERDVARLLELCDLADLVEPVWQPDGVRVRHGDRAADWLEAPPAEQWLALVHAWATSDQLVGPAGGRDAADKPIGPVGGRCSLLTGVADARRRLLATLAALGEDTAAEPGSLRDHLGFLDPLYEATNPDLTGGGPLGDVLAAEADLLGLRAAGGVAAPARAVAADDWGRALAEASALLPDVVDQLLVQADLTVVAPGPVSAAVTRALGAMADVESRGGATTWRLSEASVRRALDAGYTAGMVLEVLDSHSVGELAQPVRYLVDDVARRHGRLRVREAAAIIRCDDEALLAEVTAHRKLRGVLDLLAPTVAVATIDAADLLARLRTTGFLPVLEDAGGDVVVAGGGGDDADPGRSSRRAMLRSIARTSGADVDDEDRPWWQQPTLTWHEPPPDVDGLIAALRRTGS
jgi:Helicase conserved C-terminal domain